MGLEKTLKRDNDISYNDYFEDANDMFALYPKKGMSFTDIEDFDVDQSGYAYAYYEVDRLISFVAMAYCEIKYGKLTNRLRGELELDIPVWDSGAVDEFLTDDEKVMVYEHLNVIKNYIDEHSK